MKTKHVTNFSTILSYIVCFVFMGITFLPETSLYSAVNKGLETNFFTFQLATLSIKDSAEQMLVSLKKKGYPAYKLVLKTKKNKVLYKIRVGRYKTRMEAEKAAEKFKAKEHKPYFIVKTTHPESTSNKQKQKVASTLKKNIEKKVSKSVTPVKQQNHGIFYTIQVRTELNKKLAETAVKKLQKKGYPAYIVVKKTNKGLILYKIRIGKYKMQKQAKQVSIKYHKKEKKPAIVVKSNPNILHAQLVSDTEKKPAESIAWPSGVSKIFAYRGDDGELNLTNNFQSIPEHSRNRIEYISIFPVKFLRTKAATLTCDVIGNQKQIKLRGIKCSSKKFPDIAIKYLEENIKDVPVRLKYNPGQITKKGIISGRFYLKNGTYINLEMVQKGIAASEMTDLSPDQQAEFKEAELNAKEKKAGIWAVDYSN